MFFYLVRGSGPKNSELFTFKDVLISVLFGYRYITGTWYLLPVTGMRVWPEKFKTKTLHSRYSTVQPSCLYQCSFRVPVQKYRYLVRGSGPKIQNYWRSRILWFIRTLAKVFIQDTEQPNCPNQCNSWIPVQNNRYSVRGSGPKNSKLLMFKDLTLKGQIVTLKYLTDFVCFGIN